MAREAHQTLEHTTKLLIERACAGKLEVSKDLGFVAKDGDGQEDECVLLDSIAATNDFEKIAVVASMIANSDWEHKLRALAYFNDRVPNGLLQSFCGFLGVVLSPDDQEQLDKAYSVQTLDGDDLDDDAKNLLNAVLNNQHFELG